MLSIENLIAELTPLLQQYGYLLLGLAIMVEGMGVPAPGQSLLVVASILASSGQMSLPLILIVAGSCAFLGNTCGYWLGRRCEQLLVRKNWISLTTIDHCHRFIKKYGLWGLLLSRFIEGLKQIMALVCGMTQMPFKAFLVANTLAVLVWLAVFGLGPAYLYVNRAALLNFYHHYMLITWLLVTLAVIVGMVILLSRWQK